MKLSVTASWKPMNLKNHYFKDKRQNLVNIKIHFCKCWVRAAGLMCVGGRGLARNAREQQSLSVLLVCLTFSCFIFNCGHELYSCLTVITNFWGFFSLCSVWKSWGTSYTETIFCISCAAFAHVLCLLVAFV